MLEFFTSSPAPFLLSLGFTSGIGITTLFIVLRTFAIGRTKKPAFLEILEMKLTYLEARQTEMKSKLENSAAQAQTHHESVVKAFGDFERWLQTRTQENYQLQITHFDTLQRHLQTFYATLLDQIQKLDKQVEQSFSEHLKEGLTHYGKIQEHLQTATLKLSELSGVSQSIQDLSLVLKMPHLRGTFGEAQLERILSDFLPAQSFLLQTPIPQSSSQHASKLSETSRDRPDALVQIQGKWLAIDSKFPRESILPLFENTDSEALEAARKHLSSWIKLQAKEIHTKYIRPDLGTADMAFLFLPSETLYFEVIRNNDCLQALSQLRVFIVSPNTLALSLQAISLAQDRHIASKNVEKTLDSLHKAKKHFDKFNDKFSHVGAGLKKAQEHFDLAQKQLSFYENTLDQIEPATCAALAESFISQ